MAGVHVHGVWLVCTYMVLMTSGAGSYASDHRSELPPYGHMRPCVQPKETETAGVREGWGVMVARAHREQVREGGA